MIIENMLAHQMRAETRRTLAFDSNSARLPPDPPGDKPVLLYIHVPFCEQLCPYCSFNRILFEPAMARRYFACLRKEMKMYRQRGFVFDALYVGGGTPTVLPGELADLLKWIRSAWPIRQISVETNANHLTPEVVAALKEGAVNRLSVGVQTFADGLLDRIGRLQRHGSGQAMQEKLTAVAGQFDTLNVDLIFNLPGQTDAMMETDVRIIKRLNVDQVTFYPLMGSTTTQTDLQGRWGRTSSRRERQLFRVILRELSADYVPASAWCFSRNRGMIDEYIVQYGDYVGLGSGAFGYVGGSIYSNTFSVEKYMEQLDGGTLPIAASRRFTGRQRAAYDFLMGLFGNELDVGVLRRKYGRRIWRYLWKELLLFTATRAAVWKDGRLRVTPRGRYYLVVLMREFFTGVNNLRETCARLDRAV